MPFDFKFIGYDYFWVGVIFALEMISDVGDLVVFGEVFDLFVDGAFGSAVWQIVEDCNFHMKVSLRVIINLICFVLGKIEKIPITSHSDPDPRSREESSPDDQSRRIYLRCR